MKAHIKTGFEDHLISLCTADGNKRYLTIGGTNVYIWFEDENIVASDAYIKIKIVPTDTTRPATGVKYHTGYYRLFVYGLMTVHCDKFIDHLSTLLDEQTINGVNGRIETGILGTFQRGNRFAGSSLFETIANIDFSHWESTV